jgi:hypothetical protein
MLPNLKEPHSVAPELGSALMGLMLVKENQERKHLKRPAYEASYDRNRWEPPSVLVRRLYRTRRRLRSIVVEFKTKASLGTEKGPEALAGASGEVAWGTSLALYEALLLGDKAWWWQIHFHLWRAYKDWNPDEVLERLSEDENLGTLAYGETPASSIKRALQMCREHCRGLQSVRPGSRSRSSLYGLRRHGLGGPCHRISGRVYSTLPTCQS